MCRAARSQVASIAAERERVLKLTDDPVKRARVDKVRCPALFVQRLLTLNVFWCLLLSPNTSKVVQTTSIGGGTGT
jgi:hypothetical protein